MKIKPNYFVIPAVVFFVAAIGSYFTDSGMEWYKTINLPSFTPPGWVIGAVWTAIFILSALSALIFWNKGRGKDFRLIVFFFLLNAVLNVLWSYLFFSKHLIAASFFEAVFLDITVFILILLIWPVSKLSSVLLLPYFVWVAFASFLTFNVWMLNL